MRIWLLCVGLILSGLGWAGDSLVVLVRHAEKAGDDPRDPTLSAAGSERAQALARALAGYGLQAVWVSPYRRTALTAAPAAAAAGVQPQVYALSSSIEEDARQLAGRIRADHQGQAVLVVGHSNTVGAIVQALGGGVQTDIADDEYDRLYLLSIDAEGVVRSVVSRY